MEADNKMKVWYQLGDEQASKVEVKENADVDDLKMAIKTAESGGVPYVARKLKVYAAGKDPSKDEPLDPRALVTDSYKGKEPLIVVAAPATTQQQQNGEYRCCCRIFVFVELFEYGNASLFLY